MQKQSKYLWLAIPPILAVLVFYGPMAERTLEPKTPAAAAAPTTTPGVPPTPDLWRIGSSLLGVLLIGGIGLVVFARLRGGSPAASRPGRSLPLTLRQCLRLSNKHRVYAIEFEDRMLLVGECENNLALLSTTPDSQASRDEDLLAKRVEDQTEQGVDLRDTADMVIQAMPPRPGEPMAPGTGGRNRTAANPLNRKADVAAANLADFKSLLRKARAQA